MSITTLYYLQQKKENAHDDSIWCCGWSKIGTDKQKNEENNDMSQDYDNPQEISENYIITGGLDDLVKIWQIDNGKLELKHKLEGHSLGVISVVVSPDGKTLASSSQDSSLILWDIASGDKLKSFETGTTDVWTLDFSPDGKHVISGSNAGKILIFSVESGKQEQTLDTRGKFTLSVAYSPDGKYIASGALDGIINIFDVAQGKLVHTLEGHAMPIRSLCFSPDSQLLLTASDDGHMKLYDVVHANLAGTLSGHASWVLSVAFSPDGKRFVSGSADRTVRVWDLDSMQCQNVFKEHTDQNSSILFKKENAHDEPIYCCAWTRTCITNDPKGPSKEFILTGALDGLVKVWMFENNKLELVHTLVGHCMAVVSIAVSPDGHSIASTSLDSTLIVWDLLSGNKVHEVETSVTDVWKVTFSPDGSQVATGSHTGKVVVYDIRNVCIFDVVQGKLLHTIEAHRQTVRSIAFSPDSKFLLTASDDGTVKIYDVASANPCGAVEHKSWAVCAVFSPDGSRVATSTSDGSVRIVSLDGLKVLNTFREHVDTVWGVHFNAKGNRLLSVAKDKSLIMYECPIPPKSTVKK
ncbi:unnamed protein product [Diatraea saccharalis]|uniref:WD repeat-containing protein 61 n=1 Tax=Diatraea saccharalis TaxID=40085 RepID=A0A9N9R693_9NEOP|nr:unnamed protein product [Diatraea saccharalis]